MRFTIPAALANVKPGELQYPPPASDHASLAILTALKGYPELGADNLLNPAVSRSYSTIVGQVCRQAHLEFLKASELESGERLARRVWLYSLLIEVAMNTVGLEADWARVPEAEREKAFAALLEELTALEREELSEAGRLEAAEAAVALKLEDMRKVMSSNPKVKSMLSWIAERVEQRLDEQHPASSFVREMAKEIWANAYYRMSKLGLCRFGNDYALGLRWLRHLGFVQVSTNPVLAAEAYKDDPSLWDKFRDYLRRNPALLEKVDSDPDALAMAATLIALWPNMEVFRPVAYLLDFQDGMISYQL
ncbi:MAG: hypothetical protein QXI55_07290, partial [Thermofilum sp.]